MVGGKRGAIRIATGAGQRHAFRYRAEPTWSLARIRPTLALTILAAGLPAAALADDGHVHAAARPDAAMSPAAAAVPAPRDIPAAHLHRDDRRRVFHMTLVGTAGCAMPQPAEALAGAPVIACVWPTALDPSAVGSEPGTGHLALAASSHPDFDDTAALRQGRGWRHRQ